MIGWLIYRLKDAQKNKGYIDFYFEEGNKLGIDIRLILVEDLTFGVKNNTPFIEHKGKSLTNPNFVINRSRYPLLTKQLEEMGLKVFNNYKVAAICNDKAMTYQYISKLKVATIDSIFVKARDLKVALNNICKATIIKGVSGHGGNQVYLYDPTKDSEDKKARIIESLANTDVVIQPFIGSGGRDLRVYIIGKTIIASILRTAKYGFKSNYSLGGEVRTYSLSSEEEEIINRITNAFDFGLVGIDFLIDDEGRLIFNEIEDVVGARMLYQCTDINLVNLYLKHIMDCIK